MSAIAILKIILWILLSVLLLFLLLCLLNVKIKIYGKDKYGYKLTVGGIRVKPEWFLGRKEEGKNREKDDKSEKHKVSKKKTSGNASENGGEKSKSSVANTVNIITRVISTARDTIPKSVRIRLKYLNINVGGSDAAQTALNYGKIQALLHGMFALFEDYKGFLYGFRAKRSKVTVNADFFAAKTTAEFEMSVSFFVWQLLFSAVRIGIGLIAAIIENGEDAESAEEAVPKMAK